MHEAAPRALIHTSATILHVTPLPCNNYIIMYMSINIWIDFLFLQCNTLE